MPPPRAILHVDMDAFFASVEQRDNPQYRGKPLLVGGSGPRGVVAAASYEARTFGCHSAQPTAVALRLCPDAIVVSGRHSDYKAISRQVFDILERFSPAIQPISIDEAFLDVTGRVARTLLELSKEPDALTHPEGMQIKITRQEIGRIVGCSREMVGRVLKTLEDQGLVTVTGKTMVVYGTR